MKDIFFQQSGHPYLSYLYEDGTVDVWTEEEEEKAAMPEEIYDWNEIEMAVAGCYYSGEYQDFAAGLKADGTVIATGEFAEWVSEWEDIVYLEASWGLLADLTSDGYVLVVGPDKEDAEYGSLTSNEKHSPEEWEARSRNTRHFLADQSLSGILMEKFVMIVTIGLAGLIRVLVLGMVGITVFGPSGRGFFGLLASWAGVWGPLFLIAFLVSSVFSGYTLYG